jgi:hypothetical protein
MGAIEMYEMAKAEQEQRLSERSAWTKKVRSVEDFFLEEYPDPGWHVEGLIPKASLVFFAGVPGSYKTFLALACSFAMREGRNLFDRIATPKSMGNKTEPANILFIEEEMNGGIFQIRMKAMIRDGNPVRSNISVSTSSGFKLSKPEDVASLRSLCIERNIKLVFMDPFSSVLGARNESDNSEVSEILDGVRRAIVDDPAVGASVVMIHHPAKNAEGESDSLRGAGDITGKADHIMVFKRDDKLPRTTIRCFKSRLVDKTDEPILEVEFKKKDDLIGLILMDATKPGDYVPPIKETKKTKVEELSENMAKAAKALGKPTSQKEMLAWMRITKNGTTDDAIRMLKEKGQIVINADGLITLNENL